jgi:tetratricopeptide (TPR) repeat protein
VTEEEYRAACREDTFHPLKRTNNMRLIYAGADNFRRIALHLWKDRRPRLLCAYFEMLDAVCHNFMAYRDPVTWKPREPEEVVKIVSQMRPDADADWVRSLAARARGRDSDRPPIGYRPGDEKLVTEILGLARGATEENRARWKDAVDAAYEWTDRLLGEAMAALDGDSVLLVVSDHGWLSGVDGPGMKPPFDAEFNALGGGGAFHRPVGVLGAFGKGVRRTPPPPGGPEPGEGTPGKEGVEDPRKPRPPARPLGRLVDVAPTILALLGFPKAEDMPGKVLADLFEADLALPEVPTYETGRSTRLARESLAAESRKSLGASADPGERDALEESLRQVEAVGYVGSAEDADFRALDHMAASFQEQGRLRDALEAHREALKVAPKRFRCLTLARIGMLLRALKDRDGARREFEAALAERPEFPPALIGLAFLAAERGDLDGTIDAWERVVKAEAANPQHRVGLADALRQRSDALRRSPETLERSRLDLARALLLLREAAMEGRKGAPPPDGGPDPGETDPGHGLGPSGRNILGMVLLRRNQFGPALEQLRKAADDNPDYIQPRTNLGVLHLNAAAESFRAAAAEGDPERRAALERSGRAHREEALRCLGEALDINPDHAKALYNRAEVHYHLAPRDLEAAARDLEAALAADPDYGRARELLDRIRQEVPK